MLLAIRVAAVVCNGASVTTATSFVQAFKSMIHASVKFNTVFLQVLMYLRKRLLFAAQKQGLICGRNNKLPCRDRCSKHYVENNSMCVYIYVVQQDTQSGLNE